METSKPKKAQTPQEILRSVVELCADCDTCRTIMDEDCPFFPELYRLWDQEATSGVSIDNAQLRQLVELCTLCGLCPCPKIPIDVMEAKSLYITGEGLPLSTRFLTDVPRLAKLCGTFPRLVNALQANTLLGPLLRKGAGIHPDRHAPEFPEENFFQWAARNGPVTRQDGQPLVSYFAGCTAGYLFPQVGRAVVEVLERNGVAVHIPEQGCCGMPHLVEGDRQTVLWNARSTMDRLLEAKKVGDDLVTSCPTCGFFLKHLLKERAVYSEAYQRSVHAGEDEIKVPESGRGNRSHKVLKKSMYKEILKDDGYFSPLDPIARIELAEHLFDAGEYLARLHGQGRLDTRLGAVRKRMVYFAPCHQREQKMGSPYFDLLALIPELVVESVGKTRCCGMGGNFGFKADFHEQSLEVGEALMENIREKDPQAIVTDCMSCSLQFRHALPYPVFHPVEILAMAYALDDKRS
jgi:glycerol-3-phosphate dehydrogenase subunit C